MLVHSTIPSSGCPGSSNVRIQIDSVKGRDKRCQLSIIVLRAINDIFGIDVLCNINIIIGKEVIVDSEKGRDKCCQLRILVLQAIHDIPGSDVFCNIIVGK